MWAAGAAGHAGEAEAFALADFVACLHVDLIEVAIKADQAVAVVDENTFAVEEIIVGGEHDARRGGVNRRATRHGEIKPAVGRAFLVVKKAAQTKAAR